MTTLTIFTPTFNRAYTLNKCYESLKRQSCKDFIWLVVDDGSKDNTKELISSWIEEKIVPIKYVYQENQGMHGAHNTAYELIDTELNVCIDSDDYIPDDAVEKIITFWRINGSGNFAGFVGLDATPDGEVIGTVMPKNVKESTLLDLYGKYGVKGDKKLVYRTEVIKATPPYPVFKNEKYCPLSYKYILVDQKHPLLIFNEILCYVEYMPDGSSMNIINQYRKNPRGFAFFRKVAIKYSPTLIGRYRECLHYVSSSLMIKNSRFIIESPNKTLTLMAVPMGVLLYLYLKNTSRATVFKQNS
ncbi:glycosyltransferase family A protein [Robertmurraya sp.]|uniref:glycosyltransferase family A protein n=1 Tax=Robertmurraya sp. TaxID=2837525 RepID=UPI003703A09D